MISINMPFPQDCAHCRFMNDSLDCIAISDKSKYGKYHCEPVNQRQKFCPLRNTEIEEVYNQYYDTAGNYHWTRTSSGEHKIDQFIELLQTIDYVMSARKRFENIAKDYDEDF